MNSIISNHLSFTILGFKGIGIRKFEFIFRKIKITGVSTFKIVIKGTFIKHLVIKGTVYVISSDPTV